MRARVTLLVILGLLCARFSTAAALGFTDRAAFDAATAGLPGMNTLNFDSLPTGVLGAGPFQGITFAFSTGGFDATVEDRNDTTSPAHDLGTAGDGVFLAGDSFTMTFAPTRALGLYVIAIDTLQAGDFTLTASGGSQSTTGLPDSAFAGGLADGGQVFFLGLVDTDLFTAATFSSAGLPADFVFNIDDITGQIGEEPPGTTPVPEPSTLALLASGLAAAVRVRRMRGVRA